MTTFCPRISAFILALACALALAADAAAHEQRPCLEDEPCWTWSTMGNLDRGITTTSGRHRVVEPCTFAYLDMRGRIDWKRTPRLKGDGFARRHGCNPRYYA